MVQRDFLYLVEADARLRSECMRALLKLYGEDMPGDIQRRVLRELELVMRKKDSDVLMYFTMICRKLSVFEGEIVVRGDVNSLYIAYLLGIISVDPMELDMDIEPPYLFDDNRKLRIDILIPQSLRQKLHDVLRELEGVNSGDQYLLTVNSAEEDGAIVSENLLLLPFDYLPDEDCGWKIDGETVVIAHMPVVIDPSLIRLRICYTKEINMLHELIKTSGVKIEAASYKDFSICSALTFCDEGESSFEWSVDILGINNQKLGNYYGYFEIESFVEFIRVIGLMYGSGLWYFNGRLRMMEGATLQDIITCKNDIYDLLLEKGVSASDAYAISDFVGDGRTAMLVAKEHLDTWCVYEKILADYNIDKVYIESLRNIRSAMCRADLVAIATVIWQFGYFKKYYADLYSEVYKKYREKV